ncbi:hypothetical protein WN48_05347 [Eufriesea mexicana]|uniref:uncharacterized protein LOC108545170 n=1 Tax=Eufriesea mexicana TaxID=516756 RepID=UPI00083C6DAD|nr:PREDICTED: uncharacterized protein LOC108545170 [Eufriesea mexicana]OAD60300.1 hypothetical protein WN48_05347 [Eufriesea mexicana]
MFAIQSVVRSVPRLSALSKTQNRTMMGTPPRVRIPFAEKVILGIVLYVGLMGVPLYISCNINKYNEGKGQ